MCVAVIISVTKEGVKFSTAGDIGTANIVCRQNKTVDKVSGIVSPLVCIYLFPFYPFILWFCGVLHNESQEFRLQG